MKYGTLEYGLILNARFVYKFLRGNKALKQNKYAEGRKLILYSEYYHRDM